jgi:hypothetical protein
LLPPDLIFTDARNVEEFITLTTFSSGLASRAIVYVKDENERPIIMPALWHVLYMIVISSGATGNSSDKRFYLQVELDPGTPG